MVAVALMAAALIGTAWSSAVAQATDEGAAGTAAAADYSRGLHLFHNGRYAEALPYFVTAKDEAAAQHGEGSSEYATALNNLAELYRLMERYDEAEPLFRQALAIEEARLGPNDPGLARPLNNMALLHRAQGRYEEAERDLKRSLAILEDSLGRRHPDVAGSLNNLARLYETMGLNERAEPLLERALMIAEGTLGPVHPSTQQIRSNLQRVSAALAEAGERAPGTAEIVAEAADDGPPPTVGPPAELVLPPSDRPISPAAIPLVRPPAAVAVAEPLVVAPALDAPAPLPSPRPLPEPAAGPAAVAEAAAPLPATPAPEAPRVIAMPEVASATPEAPVEAGASAEADQLEARDSPPVAPAAGGGDDDLEAEAELALLVPLPEARPSGRRWATLADGRYAIHLASVRSPGSASEEWDRLRGILDLPSDIGQLEPRRVEVADRGVFYRVLGGPFASQAEAVAACGRIRDEGDYCAVLGYGD